MTLRPRGHMKSGYKLKTKYALFCKAYGCRTWQSGDEGNSPIMSDAPLISWGSESCDHVRSMTTKHGRLAICKSRNGESGNGMMGIQGIRVGMQGIGVGMRGIRVGMMGIRVGMRGINWDRKNNLKVYKIQFSFLAEIKKESEIRIAIKC